MSIKSEIAGYKSYKMFCTPGHKGTLLKSDITEIDSSFPADCIAAAEQMTAAIYGAKAVRFLTGGSSIGVKSALMGFGDLLVQSNSHRSVLDAAELSGSRVYYIDSEVRDGLFVPPDANRIERALKEYPEVQTVVLTSPDYYGQMASEAAIKAVMSSGKRLHIDAAHGAHLFFRRDLFDCRGFEFAHSFNVSAHKTLPAYTSTAYLCINDLDSLGRIDHNLALLGTTSPFYPFLATLESAAEWTNQNSGHYDELLAAVKALTKRVKTAKTDDFTRIVVDCNDFNCSGQQLYFRLKNRGIIAEKFDERYVVFIVTVCDSCADVDFLADTLCDIRDGHTV